MTAKDCSLWLLFIGIVLILNACGSVAQRTQRDGLVVQDDGGISIDPFYQIPSDSSSGNPRVSSKSNSRNKTILAFLSQARDQERAGHPERAAAIIERALRVDPQNAQLWYRLALLRMQQKKYALAASLAAKSNALARNDSRLQSKNTTLIQQTKILRGQ